MQQNANGTDIAVIGGGPAGMAAALEAAARGFDVTIVSPPDRRPDQRTTALMMPAIAWLEAHGVWQALQGSVAPLRTMRILDATGRLVRSPPATFRASEIDETAFGYNMPNTALNAALAQAVDAEPRIRRVIAKSEWVRIGDRSVTIGIEDAGPVEAQLAVAADGRKSSTRIAARIDTVEWSYPQTALVTCFSHQRPHGDASNEFHTVTGPFTTVPLPGNRCSLVWVETPHRARELAALDPAALSRIIEERMQSMLGKVEVDAPVQLWPLSGMVARRFAEDRVLLVGEAAHAFPPLGAQG
ncbi:MAG TPA: FAD-dependent monooxygenase, partial [Rhizobiaceae bacterium]|nr:FAD-dependent monooxygenase [Rhizobiaceae bacterium]